MNLIPLFAYGTLLLQIIGVLLVLLFLFRFLQPKDKSSQSLSSKISNNAIVISFLIASIATLGSLYLSEIRGFTPCKLCWFQRIFMYPQVIILGMSMFINDVKVRFYALILSIIGFGIAIYHILVQFLPTMFQCSDEVANCALKQTSYFGYVTIPVMSATAFGFIIIVLLFSILPNKPRN